MFLWLEILPTDILTQNKWVPGLIIEHFYVKFVDPTCIGFWRRYRAEKQTDTQKNVSKKLKTLPPRDFVDVANSDGISKHRLMSYKGQAYSYNPPILPLLIHHTAHSLTPPAFHRPASRRVGGRPSPGRARQRSGSRHCTVGQYGYVPLGRHLVLACVKRTLYQII